MNKNRHRRRCRAGRAGHDRLIQQALLQVLQPLIDPNFSEHSHGFRPGRRAHDAVKAARAYVQAGKRIDDVGVIRLVRAYLNAGIMDGGVVVERHLSEAKSAVGSALGRKFLGYALWVAKGREVKCKVAQKPMLDFKARIRQLTRRSGGRSMEQVVQRLRPYLLGWKTYFGLAQTPGVWRELDEWLRHRLRAIQLKHWKRPTTMYRELKALGAGETVARRVAGNSRCWWRHSDRLLKTVPTIACFDKLGVPRLS